MGLESIPTPQAGAAVAAADQRGLRQDPEANRLFLGLITRARDPETILRRMNEAGVLGRFIPPFGRIVAMMQFNMYHHYTVDEHLLRAVGMSPRSSAARSATSIRCRPRCFTRCRRRAARRFMSRHSFTMSPRAARKTIRSPASKSPRALPAARPDASETETVAWLVRHHLAMSETAQMRDLNDFKTILDFAAHGAEPGAAEAAADPHRCRHPRGRTGVWNGWKGQLLRTLYFETEPVLAGGHMACRRRSAWPRRRAKFFAQLSPMDDERAQGYVGAPLRRLLARGRHRAPARPCAADARTPKPKATAVGTAITHRCFHGDHRVHGLRARPSAAAGADHRRLRGGRRQYRRRADLHHRDGMALDTILIQPRIQRGRRRAAAGRAGGRADPQGAHGRTRCSRRCAGAPPAQAASRPSRSTPRVIIDNAVVQPASPSSRSTASTASAAL